MLSRQNPEFVNNVNAIALTNPQTIGQAGDVNVIVQLPNLADRLLSTALGLSYLGPWTEPKESKFYRFLSEQMPPNLGA